MSGWSEFVSSFIDTLSDPTEGRSGTQQLLRAFGNQWNVDLSVVWLLSPEGQLRHHGVWSDPVRDPTGALRASRSKAVEAEVTLPYHVLRSGQPLWIECLADDERFAFGPAARAGLRTALLAPIYRSGSLVGVLELFCVAPQPPESKLRDVLADAQWATGQGSSSTSTSGDHPERLLAELSATRQRLEFLLRAGQVVAETEDYGSALHRLAEVAVPSLADLCLIDVTDDSRHLTRMIAYHHDPTMAEFCQELRERFPPDPVGQHPTIDVMNTQSSRWSGEMTDEFLLATTRDRRHYEIVKAMQFESYMSVPLLAGDRSLLGTLTLVSAGSHRRFNEDDLSWAEQLAGHVASVLRRVNRFQREHDISHILQRSLLPTVLPELPGVRLAARYLPATVDAEVGGDWYDVIADGHKIAFVVGDVEGHDMNAATVMGTLRNALNAFLGETYDPQDALVRLNRFARRSHLSKLATALVVVVDLATAELTAASAGHLPPILRGAGGAAFIEVRPAPPLGLDWDHVDQSRLRLPTASADLVLYTDGLVERPGFSLEARFAELIDAVNSGLPSGEHMCDQILETMLPSVRTDDIAILTVAITLVDQAPDASGDAD